MKKIVSVLCVFCISITNIILFFLSVYIVWGWLTFNDIYQIAKNKDVDSDELLSIIYLYHNNTKPKIETEDTPCNKENKILVPSQILAFSRWLPVYKNSETKQDFDSNGRIRKEIKQEYWFSFLSPFLCISKNVANFLFCFGIGSLISLIITIVKVIKKDEITQTYLLLRPILGGLSSACLFLVIISGGALLWENVSSVKDLSLGIIAVIGALYCERFETVLSGQLKRISGNANKE